MSRLSIRPIADRHVVFPDLRAGWHPIVNYAPIPGKPASVESLSTDELESARWLFAQAGLNLDDYRNETVKRRMAACLRALRVASPADIPAAVRRNPQLLNIAISALTIGVTAFFRDPPVFAALADSVLPDLLARSPSPRIWSIGCSDGAELYSIAILLAERGAVHRCTLLGTDCRADALAAARQGRFEPTAIKGIPMDFLGRHFTFDGTSWHVHPFLRTIPQWRRASALSIREPGAWDLILCRNMAIYMQPSAAARLWAGLEQCVRPGGALVLGKAERPLGAPCLSAIAPCIYRRDRSCPC
jgi:chemotaxis protein methyltransferase CheR